MTRREGTIFGWTIWLVGFLMLGIGISLATTQFTQLELMPLLFGISQGFAVLALGAIGLVLALRRPENPIGWLYLAVWTLLANGALASGVADWAATQPAVWRGRHLRSGS